MNSEKLKKQLNETVNDYILRVCSSKLDFDLTWEDVAHIINVELGENLSERSYRRKYEKLLNMSSVNIINDVETLLEMKKERVKLQDERSQINYFIRLQAREEAMREMALEAVEKIASIKQLEIPKNNKRISSKQEKIGTLAIGDWHYGLEVDVFYNKYNPELCRKRVKELAIKCIDISEKEGLEILNIVNLGDMISGRIHLPLRLQNRCDAVTQTMEVSELIAEFLNILSEFVNINYYSVSDNHSRIEPNKKESFQPESFTRIIDWYLKERMKDNGHIRFFDNVYGDDICTFKIFDHTLAAVHGDKDKTNKVISNLNLYLQNHLDIILTAHLHHFSADESNETIRFCNGSLMGCDDFSSNLRLNSKPSQLFIVSTPTNVSECVYKIDVK